MYVKAVKDETKLIIATVGLADVNDKANTDNIKKSIANAPCLSVVDLLKNKNPDDIAKVKAFAEEIRRV